MNKMENTEPMSLCLFMMTIVTFKDNYFGCKVRPQVATSRGVTAS